MMVGKVKKNAVEAHERHLIQVYGDVEEVLEKWHLSFVIKNEKELDIHREVEDRELDRDFQAAVKGNTIYNGLSVAGARSAKRES